MDHGMDAKQRHSLEDFIATLHEKRETLARRLMQETPLFAEYVEVDTALRVTERVADEMGQQRRPGMWSSVAKRLILDRGEPVKLSEIHAALLDHGVDMHIRNLSSRLSASDLFYSTGTDGWAVSESRRPPASSPRKRQGPQGDLFGKLPEGSAG